MAQECVVSVFFIWVFYANIYILYTRVDDRLVYPLSDPFHRVLIPIPFDFFEISDEHQGSILSSSNIYQLVAVNVIQCFLFDFLLPIKILKPIVDAKSKLKRQWQLQGYKIEDTEIRFILNNQDDDTIGNYKCRY
ncbi:unnamed protein product [Lactuca saligna]|uniref:Uncharacterized protein n=1 Tax=Lactuca saligna TaxID=75948 RepID=A0AA36A5X0_LACSI|nr:unnamed protein product [Lactuca saligna]